MENKYSRKQVFDSMKEYCISTLDHKDSIEKIRKEINMILLYSKKVSNIKELIRLNIEEVFRGIVLDYLLSPPYKDSRNNRYILLLLDLKRVGSMPRWLKYTGNITDWLYLSIIDGLRDSKEYQEVYDTIYEKIYEEVDNYWEYEEEKKDE